MPDYHTLGASFEIKAVDDRQRIIEGAAAVAGNLDRVGDIIAPGALVKAARKAPGEVGVFIGHDQTRLPVGIPIEIVATANGLMTRTKIFKTTAGDDLLQTARELLAHGRTLGMSIGYYGSGKPERVDGKVVRMLTDIDLIEYSFAASQSIANPLALVTGVKTAEQQAAEDKAAVGSFDWTRAKVTAALSSDLERYCSVVELYPDRVVYRCYLSGPGEQDQLYRRTYTIDANGSVTLGDPSAVDVQYVPMTDPMPAAKTSDGERITSVKDLPNDAFLYVEPGDDDEDGRRVPRSKRHHPYRDAEGKLDPGALALAVKAIAADGPPGLDPDARRRLQARAQRLLAGAAEGKTAAQLETPEWADGAALDVLWVSQGLADLAGRIAEQRKAMAALGIEVKAGQVRAESRQELKELHARLTDILTWSETVDRDEDGRAKLARYKRQLELLEVS